MKLAKLKAAAVFARDEERGFAGDPFTAVRVEKSRILACDAHAMIVIENEDGPESPVMVDPAAVLLLRGDVSKMDGAVLTGGIVTVDASSSASPAAWPDVDPAMPKADALESPVGISIDILEQIVEAAKLLKVRVVQIQIPKDGGKGRLSALRVTPVGGKAFVIIAMPCRLN